MINAIGKAFQTKDILKLYEGREKEFYRLKLKSLKKDLTMSKIKKDEYVK